MSRRIKTIVLANAMNASLTVARRSVLVGSFMKPRVCQALVRYTTLRSLCLKRFAIGTDLTLVAQGRQQSPDFARILASLQVQSDLFW